MGSSPIARSMFFLLVFIHFFSVSTVYAQVTTDTTLPFQEGEVVQLPATTAYLGDLPHFIHLIQNDSSIHTFEGLQAPLVGWNDPLGQNTLGLRSRPAGLFFENIAYPLVASPVLNSFPAAGTMQMLDFPAQGWLGPTAVYGAINLTAPETRDHWSNQATGWGGTGSALGVGDRFENSAIGADLNYRHTDPGSSNGSFDLISKENWFSNGGLNGGTGFLGMQDGLNNHWYAAFLDLGLSSPNFQTIEFKPYYQNIQNTSQSAQDYGGFLNYLFNLAGLAESHIGVGYDSMVGSGVLAQNKGFLQSTDLVDVLGDVTLDSAFRWDFSSQSNTTFSTVLGLQGKMDSWTFLGDYNKGVSPVTNQDIQQADAGVRYQPEDRLSLTTKYIYEQLGNAPFNGVDLLVLIDQFSGWGPFHRFELSLEERILADANGNTQYDSGASCRFGFTSQDHWWVGGRSLSQEAVFLEAGADYALDPSLKLFASFENLTGVAQSWPDLDRPSGFVTSVGVQFSTD